MGMVGLRTMVYMVGAHTTGKTTLARWTATTYGFTYLNEVARAVITELETDFVRLRTSLPQVTDYQTSVFQRQVLAEQAVRGSFVSDRSGLDSLCYSAQHTLSLKSIYDGERAKEYTECLRQKGSIVFLVRPRRELLAEDGTREIPVWDELIRIDGMLKFLLEFHDVDYIAMDTPSLAERARTVRAVLRAAGVLPPPPQVVG